MACGGLRESLSGLEFSTNVARSTGLIFALHILRLYASVRFAVPESASFCVPDRPEKAGSICDGIPDANVTSDRPRLAARASKLKSE